jgi:hypothetical protein
VHGSACRHRWGRARSDWPRLAFPEYQERLLREAISRYGSEAEATRWVATRNTSAYVNGDVADIWPSGAAAWLSARPRMQQ